MKKLLRIISFGKYQTTIYNKSGSAFYSSAMGGLITLLVLTVISGIGFYLLLDIFLKNHYNLTVSSIPINALIQDSSDTLYPINDCDNKRCINVLTRDANRIFDNNIIIEIVNASCDTILAKGCFTHFTEFGQ